MFLFSGSGVEEMELYDDDEEGDSDGGIEVDDDGDDDEIEESIPPVNGDGSSKGIVLHVFHEKLYMSFTLCPGTAAVFVD